MIYTETVVDLWEISSIETWLSIHFQEMSTLKIKKSRLKIREPSKGHSTVAILYGTITNA